MIECSNCGADNDSGSKFCFNCGEKLIVHTSDWDIEEEDQFSRPLYDLPSSPIDKNPTVAAVLGLIPGVGQLYNGDSRKGVILLAGSLILTALSAGLITVILMVYAGYDAYQVAIGDKDIGQW